MKPLSALTAALLLATSASGAEALRTVRCVDAPASLCDALVAELEARGHEIDPADPSDASADLTLVVLDRTDRAMWLRVDRAQSGRPFVFSILDRPLTPDLYDRIAAAAARRMTGLP